MENVNEKKLGIKHWELKPPKNNPAKEKAFSFRLEARGALPGVGVQRGLQVLPTAAAVPLPLESVYVYPVWEQDSPHHS